MIHLILLTELFPKPTKKDGQYLSESYLFHGRQVLTTSPGMKLLSPMTGLFLFPFQPNGQAVQGIFPVEQVGTARHSGCRNSGTGNRRLSILTAYTKIAGFGVTAVISALGLSAISVSVTTYRTACGKVIT